MVGFFLRVSLDAILSLSSFKYVHNQVVARARLVQIYVYWERNVFNQIVLYFKETLPFIFCANIIFALLLLPVISEILGF